MTYLRAQLVRILLEYFANDNKRIEHALRVLHHAVSKYDYPELIILKSSG
jgi:hypothetical protein